MCVCIHIYVHTYTCTYTVCVYVCVWVCIYIYMYVCELCGARPPVPTHWWQGVYVYVWKREGEGGPYVYLYKNIHFVCVCVCVCVYSYVYMRIFFFCHTIDGKGWVSVLKPERQRGLYPLTEEIRLKIFGYIHIYISPMQGHSVRLNMWNPKRIYSKSFTQIRGQRGGDQT